MLRKPLKTNIVYKKPLGIILNHINTTGLCMDNFSIKITRFDITKISKFIVKENRIDMLYGRNEVGDNIELSGKMKVFFINSVNEGMMIVIKMIISYSNDYDYDMYVKSYIYTYMKCMIENDVIINSMYPGGKICLPEDIYRNSDVFNSNEYIDNSAANDRDDTISIISDKSN